MKNPSQNLRVMIGGLGYRGLIDHSIGVMVSDHLAERAWPPGIGVEDVSYNPIAVVQRLEDDRPGRVVLVAAIARAGRRPGTVEAYRWDRVLPEPVLIQRAVEDAVTGVIFLDNTLIVGEHFGGWPKDVAVVEVEPLTEEFGYELSSVVSPRFDEVCELVTRLAVDDEAPRRLLETSIGCGRGLAVAL